MAITNNQTALITRAQFKKNYEFIALNSYDYGVLQNRVRVYIVGFRNKKYFDKFFFPERKEHSQKLHEVLGNIEKPITKKKKLDSKDLFGDSIPFSRTKFQKKDELNDFFLFNDIRNGHSTIHSWDLIETTDFEKEICYLLLKNRRKKLYGKLDGNPLSIKHLKELSPGITKPDINKLIKKGILKSIDYQFKILDFDFNKLDKNEIEFLNECESHIFTLDELKISKELKRKKISFSKVIPSLIEKGIIICTEKRFDFKFTKISSGIFGINRIYMPTSDVYSTLVASDTNDFVSELNIEASSVEEYKEKLIQNVYLPGRYRKITVNEACVLQGFPETFMLPENRTKWMKLIGNSVSVPVINSLTKEIVRTGVFN